MQKVAVQFKLDTVTSAGVSDNHCCKLLAKYNQIIFYTQLPEKVDISPFFVIVFTPICENLLTIWCTP